MSYDIYGNKLSRGHCEVHPYVHEEYPCSVCLAEKQQYDDMEKAMYSEQQQAYEYDMMRKRIAELEAQLAECQRERDALREAKNCSAT